MIFKVTLLETGKQYAQTNCKYDMGKMNSYLITYSTNITKPVYISWDVLHFLIYKYIYIYLVYGSFVLTWYMRLTQLYDQLIDFINSYLTKRMPIGTDTTTNENSI